MLNISTQRALAYKGQKLTYAQLDSVVSALSLRLIDRGVTDSDRVPILMDRSISLIAAVIAVQKIGAAYVPVDPSYPDARISHMLDGSESEIIITQKRFAENYQGKQQWVETIDDSELAELASVHDPSKESNGLARRFSYLIFTSGSTGQPKGVLMPHRALSSLLEWQQKELPLQIGERTLQFTSLSFDVSFQEIFSTLCFGGTLVLIDEESRRDPALLWKYIEENKINRLYMSFFALNQLARAASQIDHLPRSLKHIITAGEQLQCTESIREMFKRLPGTRLHNHYGPSETHVVTAYTLPQKVDEWPELPPIGKSIDNVKVLFRDESGNPADPASGGELYFGGACLAEGYYNREDLTRERFDYIDGERYYKTGDLGKQLSDGNIQYLGRIDNQVKIRGNRVELGEIETVLVSHQTVKECAVVAVEKSGNKELCAYVVGREEVDPGTSALREYLKTKLPDYMLPSRILPISSLPLTPSGKVDRKKLSERLEEVESETPPKHYQPPRSQLEKEIAESWAEALEKKWVGREDNFFDIGGTSITIVNVRDLLQKRLNRDIAIPTLFQYPTISSLAKHLNPEESNHVSGNANMANRAAKQRAARQRARQRRTG